MKVVVVSKALVSSAYRQKLADLARLGARITAVVPEEWREGGIQPFEPRHDSSYDIVLSRLRFNGRFHLHFYPDLGPVLDRVRPDLVHLDEEPYNLATFLGTRAAGRRGVPSLFFSWQNIFRRYPVPFGHLERAVFRNSAAALAGSREAEEVLRLKGFSGLTSVVPQFGVDTERYSPAPEPDGPFTIGLFNRLVAAKGPLLALDALARLPGDVRMLIVGDGPLRGEVEGRVARLSLSDRVTMYSRVPSSDMPAMIRQVHVSVLPSITTPRWKEQFGRILIESMAAGVPVVGSTCGEIPAVIGDAGLVVPEGDVAALHGALEKLYDAPSLRRDLAQRGRHRSVSLYSSTHVAEATMDVYRAVLTET